MGKSHWTLKYKRFAGRTVTEDFSRQDYSEATADLGV